jgi:hypothetical protein
VVRQPDDVAFDHGNLLLIDLLPSIHVYSYPPVNRQTRNSGEQGFIEPQGLVIDGNDNIYVSDDYANEIVSSNQYE